MRVSAIQTRLAVSLIVLSLVYFGKNQTNILRMALVYAVLVLALRLLPSRVFQRKYARAIRVLFDILAISFLVRSTGGTGSSLFLLYLFPIMSASRFSRPLWSMLAAVFASLSYGIAGSVLGTDFVRINYSFGFKSLMFVAVALTASNLARARDREEDKKRLQMLYQIGGQLKEIGGQLKPEKGLHQLFENVVKLVSTRLRSEEAALFIILENGSERLEKKAVQGPDEKTIAGLRTVELSYEPREESLTRGVFDSKEHKLENHVSLSEAYAAAYRKLLPSKETRHYMGIPLLIGDEVLGVIRVLNKTAESYSPETPHLDERGFTDDDLQLLTMIATQVASAIRNAKFIERNRYFENLVYNSPDMIIVVDKNGKIQNFNHECEKLWGKDEKEVLGTPIEGYYESAEAARKVSKALWLAPEHTIQDYETSIKDGKGTVIPIRLSATLLLDKFDERAGSIGVFKDQRQIRRQEEDKIRAEKLAALGKLAHATGHDIKTDLGIIINYLEPLQRNKSVDTGARQMYSAIREATNRALNKLQNMLMTAKPKSPEKRVISLKSFLTEFEASIENTMLATRTKFFAAYPTCDLRVFADPVQIGQVLANLLGNSLDAIKLARLSADEQSAGKIELIVGEQNDDALLLWRDDGIGLSDQDKNKAFTPFFTTKDTGSGLGLYITKTIIENHGGHIALEPTQGRGVCFRMTLPLFQDSSPPPLTATQMKPVSQETEH